MPNRYTGPSDISDRFWSKVDKNGPIARPGLGPCWLWIAGVDHYGYGQFSSGGRVFKAHRLARTLLGIPLSDTDRSLHRCDVRRCVRPEHVIGGSALENTRDMLDKGRFITKRGPREIKRSYQLGEVCGSARLTASAVTEIRQRWRDGGVSQEALATEYGVSRTAISRAILRRTWVHVA